MAHCFEKIREAMGDNISDDQIKEVISNLERIKNDKDYFGKAKKIKKRSEEETAFIAHSRAQEVIALVDNKRLVERIMKRSKNPNDYFTAISSGLDYIVEGGNITIPNLRESIHRRNFNFFSHAMGGIKEVKRLTGGEWDREALHVIDALNRGKNISKFSPEAQTFGKSIHMVKLRIIRELEAAGNIVKQRDDHLLRQTHDEEKIFDATKDVWKEKISERLDHEKTFGPGRSSEEKSEILDTIFEDITSGSTPGIGFIGGKRSLHFASVDDFFEYNLEFGKGTLFEVIDSTMISSARRAAVTKVLGPNPLSTLKAMEKDILATLDPEVAKKFMTSGRFGMKGSRDGVIAEMLRTNDHPGRNLLAKFTSSTLQLMSISKLGRAIFSTVTDLGITTEMLKSVAGIPRFKGMMDSVSSFMAVLSPEELRLWGNHLDMSFDDMIMGNYDRFGLNEPGYSGLFRDIGRVVMKATLIPAQSARAKTGAARTLAINLAFHSNKNLDQLNPNIRENFKRYGIGSKEWDIIRRAKQTIGKVEAVTPEGLRELDGLSIKQSIDLENKLALYLSDNAKIGSPDVSIREKAMITNGMDIGTPEGAASRLLMQFKSFTISMPRVHRRILLSNPDIDATTLRQAIRTRSGLQQIGAIMAETTVLAAAGIIVKEMVAGKTPPEINAEFALEAFSKAALPMSSGIVLDMLRGEYDSKFRSVGKDLMGPTFGQIEDFGDFGTQIGKGEGKKALAKLSKMVLRNVPGQNLWFVSPLVNKAFLSEFHELMNPGYINRMKRRTRRKGQKYWFEPF